MSKLVKVLLGGGGTLLIVLVALIVFLRHLVTKSFPDTDGVVNIAGLHSSVDIYRDDYGVPHIKANDEHDLMFATGYVHAQDRLWQMDLLRRAGEGRLSEVMGKATIDIDVLFRTIGLARVADSIVQHLHPECKQVLGDYAEGVNAFMAAHKGKYPIEFDMLNYTPEPWSIKHSILLTRLIAWELNLSWWTDLTYGEIAARVPVEKLREIIPAVPDSVSVLVSSQEWKKNISSLHRIMEINTSYRKFFGLGSLEAGSNAWVIDSSKSLSGKPLLANDPHLAMPCPSRWYEIHLTAPGCNAAGVSLPGVPVIVIGHNEHLAWGLTNAMLDDADFFVEETDSLHANHYLFKHAWLPIASHEEKISIGSSDSMMVTVRSTHHGPIINDVHPMHQHKDSTEFQQPIAMRWTGLDVSDEVYGFYLMDKATNASEFVEGVERITVPAQNVVYADVQGNIGYWMAGRVPIRGKENALLPQPGSAGETEWKGFVPFEQLPTIWNPRGGFIASANQKIADDAYPYYLSTLWEPPSRIQRIRHLFQSAEKFSAEDLEQFQQDIVSQHAQEVTRYILQAFDTVRSIDPEISNALNYLRNWDYRYTKSDIATSIFNTFFVKLVHNIFEDEMGPDVFHDFVFFGAIPYRVTSKLLAEDRSPWFDNITTPGIETRDDILRESLMEALEELRKFFGAEMKTWRWGDLHTVTFSHPFGKRKPLDKIFDLGPFSIAGGGTTIEKTEYKFFSPFSVSVGPSMRYVIDLNDPLNAHTIITSGQSGQPLHKHYDDQTALWLNGGYHTVTMDWSTIKSEPWEHLELQPGGK